MYMSSCLPLFFTFPRRNHGSISSVLQASYMSRHLIFLASTNRIINGEDRNGLFHNAKPSRFAVTSSLLGPNIFHRILPPKTTHVLPVVWPQCLKHRRTLLLGIAALRSRNKELCSLCVQRKILYTYAINNKYTFIFMFKHVLVFFNNTFRSLLCPSIGCFVTGIQLVNTQLYYKTTWHYTWYFAAFLIATKCHIVLYCH